MRKVNINNYFRSFNGLYVAFVFSSQVFGLLSISQQTWASDQSPITLFNQGTTMVNNGNPPGAVRCFDQVLASNPKDIDALSGRAEAYEKSGKESLALRDRAIIEE